MQHVSPHHADEDDKFWGGQGTEGARNKKKEMEVIKI